MIKLTEERLYYKTDTNQKESKYACTLSRRYIVYNSIQSVIFPVTKAWKILDFLYI